MKKIWFDVHGKIIFIGSHKIKNAMMTRTYVG